MFFTGMTVTFFREFLVGLWVAFPLLLALASAVVALGQIAGRKEGWSPFDSFYWSFVTATTVGYGDVRPTRRGSRILAIVIAVLGLMFTGMIIALTVHAAEIALKAHDAASKVY